MDARWRGNDRLEFSPNYREISKQYYNKKSCLKSSTTLACVAIVVGIAIISISLYISLLFRERYEPKIMIVASQLTQSCFFSGIRGKSLLELLGTTFIPD